MPAFLTAACCPQCQCVGLLASRRRYACPLLLHRYERFVLPEGQRKVEHKQDTKDADGCSFIIQREDHTIGNLVRMQLHSDKDVVFAGYRIPHPLEHKMVVQVRTTGNKSPSDAIADALSDLQAEVAELKHKFAAEFAAAQQRMEM